MYIFNRIYLVKYIIVNVYVYTKRRKSIFNDLDTSYNFLDIKTLQYCWENIQICNVCIYIQKAEKARNMRMEDTFSTLIHQMCCVCVLYIRLSEKSCAKLYIYFYLSHTVPTTAVQKAIVYPYTSYIQYRYNLFSCKYKCTEHIQF